MILRIMVTDVIYLMYKSRESHGLIRYVKLL